MKFVLNSCIPFMNDITGQVAFPVADVPQTCGTIKQFAKHAKFVVDAFKLYAVNRFQTTRPNPSGIVHVELLNQIESRLVHYAEVRKIHTRGPWWQVNNTLNADDDNDNVIGWPDTWYEANVNDWLAPNLRGNEPRRRGVCQKTNRFRNYRTYTVVPYEKIRHLHLFHNDHELNSYLVQCNESFDAAWLLNIGDITYGSACTLTMHIETDTDIEAAAATLASLSHDLMYLSHQLEVVAAKKYIAQYETQLKAGSQSTALADTINKVSSLAVAAAVHVGVRNRVTDAQVRDAINKAINFLPEPQNAPTTQCTTEYGIFGQSTANAINLVITRVLQSA